MRLWQVDAFTQQPLKGNPAAVCFQDKAVEEDELQLIAAEMNLSETAFLTEKSNDFQAANTFGLRWLTPTSESRLCGHATLATCGNTNKLFHFDTKFSGRLDAELMEGGRFSMTFPLAPCSADHVSASVRQKVLKALFEGKSLPEDAVQRVQIKLNPSLGYLVVDVSEVLTGEQVQQFSVDCRKLHATAPADEFLGVALTAWTGRRGCEHDFVARFFAPWMGIDEDPVTGSLYTVLGPHHLGCGHTAQAVMKALQCSHRPGLIDVEVLAEQQQVKIGGHACVVLEGRLLV